MMKYFYFFFLLFIFSTAYTQDQKLHDEARTLERQFKTEEAILVYQEILRKEPSDQQVLLRITELYCMLGNEFEQEEKKIQHFQLAASFADRLWNIDSATADAHYAKALIIGRMIAFSTVREKAMMTKKLKDEVDKALQIQPSHVKAMYTLAKWNDEVSSLNPAARAALKVFFGGLPPASVDEAIKLYQSVRKLSPTFILNNYDLALALKKTGKSDQAIEILNAQMKYPVKSREDQHFKNKSRELLSSLQ
jgi:tetratricopeptide (TPR) repeat protein